MNNRKAVQLVSIGGILTSLTVIFQAAPIYLPVAGLALSPFSTLPVAIAAISNIFLGIAVLISSSLILIFISPQEAIILLFTTGALGIVLGALVYRKRGFVSIFSSALALSVGMMILTYIVAIPAFVEFTSSISFPSTILIFFIFSFVYTSIWFLGLRKLVPYFVKFIKGIDP